MFYSQAKIENKTILIAGASSGIGRQVALLLSKHNNRLILSARRKDPLEQLAKEVKANGSQALVLPCDALNKEQAHDVVALAQKHFKQIDIALLNVGDGPSFNMSHAQVDDITHNMDLNYSTLVNFLVPLIAQMKQQKSGIIAHTNSLAGFLGLPMQGPYSASKAAGRLLMDSCRIELKPFGIKFVSVYPGFVATDRVSSDGIPAPFEISEETAAQHIIHALSKQKSDYLFPFITGSLIRLARILPKPIINFLLAKSVPNNY
mgnify:CR=1 FL=1